MFPAIASRTLSAFGGIWMPPPYYQRDAVAEFSLVVGELSTTVPFPFFSS
jgi:hypothetical protein